MEVLGIKFVPWNTPLRKHCEAFSSLALLIFTFTLSALGPLLMFYCIAMRTQYAVVAGLYLFWIYVIDKNTPERGGRRSEWVRSWGIWKCAKDYFPVTLIKHPNAKFDPKQNYLLAAFPHGVIPNGGFIAFSTNAFGQGNIFPDHKVHLLVLSQHFNLPVHRDLYLALGFCSSSKNSINYILEQPKGGNMVVVYPGGVHEALLARPGSHNIVLKKRKGFIKLALQNGSPLVPVFAFGENDVYTTVDNPKGSWFRRVQDFVKEKSGFGLILVNGRGLLQHNFGFIPKQKPITILVGEPIDVQKIEAPTNEEIDALHSTFEQRMIELFEENKYKYLEYPQEAKLVVF